MCVKSYCVCLFLTDLLHLALYFLGPTTLLWLERFYPFYNCTNLHSHQQWRRVPFPPNCCQHLLFLLFFFFLILVILTSVMWHLVVLIWISQIISEVEHFSMCLLVICMTSLEKCLFRGSAHSNWIICFPSILFHIFFIFGY